MEVIEFVSSEQYEWLPLDKAKQQDKAAFYTGVDDRENGSENNPFTHDDERFIHYANGYEGVYSKQP